MTNRRRRLAQLGRVLLLVGGLAVMVWLVRAAGTEKVLDVLRHAGGWVPVVIVLEALFVTPDVVGARILLGSGAKRASLATWARATALAYASTVLLPTGRAAGEAARAATFASDVGAARAAGASTRLQAAVLLANMAFSLAIAGILSMRVSGARWLAVALATNALGCLVLGSALLAVLGSARLAAWLRRRFPRFVDAHRDDSESAPRVSTVLGVASLSFLGRIAQAAQYAVVLHAVGGTMSVDGALTAQGVHLIAAAAGDLVPSQIGAAEGAYKVFAGVLGLGATPERALSIALVVRISQWCAASVCLVVATLARRRPTEPGRTAV